MKKLTMFLALAALLSTGCSSDDELVPQLDGKGAVVLNFATSDEVVQSVTRAPEDATNYELPAGLVPEKEEFTLKVTGKYEGDAGETPYEKEWETVEAFLMENTNGKLELEAGGYDVTEKKYVNEYKAKVTYGDIEEEGKDKPYFEGVSVNDNNEEATFSVYPKQTKTVKILAKMANTCFTLHLTEWMLKYYEDIELSIHVGEGETQKEYKFTENTTDETRNIFTYTKETDATPAPVHIFVKPGQAFYISGKAVKAQNGVEVEFPKTNIRTAANVLKEYHYKITVDQDKAGSGVLNITFDDTFTEVTAVDGELNPDKN